MSVETNDTVLPYRQYQVFQMASILNPKEEIFLYYEDNQKGGYAAPGAPLNVGDDYADSLKQAVKAITGINVLEIVAPLYVHNFQVGQSETLTFNTPHYGVWFACRIEDARISEDCEHIWLSQTDNLSNIKFYHPLSATVLEKRWDFAAKYGV